MRFFDSNFIFSGFGGSYGASSNSSVASFAFIEDFSKMWASSGENTNGNAVYLERILLAPVPIDRIFVQQTNISNLTIEVDLGAGYVSLATASAFTLKQSNDGKTYFYLLDNEISIEKIKFIGSNTSPADEEKKISGCLAFRELGQIKYVSDIAPKISRLQTISKLMAGKTDIINKGNTFSCQIKFKNHYRADQNDLIQTLTARENEFWLWLNDDEEDVIVMSQEPYRFKDIYKVANQKDRALKYSKNMIYSGVDFTLDLIEVA